MTDYDSTADTLWHIKRVNQILLFACQELMLRGMRHDDSKMASPEKEIFDAMTPKLAGATYGSPDYQQFLKALKPALDHHYAHNSHHPEHFKAGIAGMNLFDLIEMLIDWKAAGERHDDGGDLQRSIDINKERFEISPQLESILRNTVEWFEKELEA